MFAVSDVQQLFTFCADPVWSLLKPIDNNFHHQLQKNTKCYFDKPDNCPPGYGYKSGDSGTEGRCEKCMIGK